MKINFAMKTLLRFAGIILWFLLFQSFSLAQGLPPGWDYVATPSTHIVSIPIISNPNINGVLLEPGDWIGVFYVDDLGAYACGGAVEWIGTANTGLIAFGDDSFTPEKDGFYPNELMHYKVYSWANGQAYDAVITCNPNLISSCTNFASGGLSGILSLNATGFFVLVSATPTSLCYGSSSQLNCAVSGGSGNNVFEWTSIPSGFSSTIQNPLVSPLLNTQYIVNVNDGINAGIYSVFVTVKPGCFAGNNQTICENQNVQLSGSASNYGAFVWSSSGDGSFSDPNILTPVYILGINDSINGNVNLSLTASPPAPCTIPAISTLNVTISQLPKVTLNDDFIICESSSAQLEAVASNYSSVFWTTNGDGTFSNISALNPLYTPGEFDKATGSAALNITVSSIEPCEYYASDFVIIGFQPVPMVNAGLDNLICENDNVALIGNASNFGQVLWTTNGDGSFENPGEISTTYIPGSNDILNGEALITLTAFSIQPCNFPAFDELLINIVKLPMVNAGSDATICQTGVHQISGIATNYDEVTWTSNGDGTIGNPNSLSTTYTPGLNDIMNGSVILILTAFPEYPCSMSVLDELQLDIVSLPQVNAGQDAVICENTVLTLSGFANNYLVIEWSTSGDGTFSNPLTLNSDYSPGPNDILTGNVQLTLTAMPEVPCTTIQQDLMFLEIVKLPIVYAGSDTTIKGGETLPLNGLAQNYLTTTWSTSGDGTFDNPGVLNAIYTPGQADISNAGVLIGLTAFAFLPCTNDALDELIITIDTLTFVNRMNALNEPCIFPNPNSGVFTIENLEKFHNNFQVQIFTSRGEMVFDETYSPLNSFQSEPLRIVFKTAKNGIYLLKVFNNFLLHEHKIIVLPN